MPGKDQLKSARKLFMVNRVKSQIMQLNDVKNEDIDTKLQELLTPLQKTFGEKEGLEILENAIVAADEVITDAIGKAVSDQVKEN